MTFNPGDIVLVQFPFTEGANPYGNVQSKKRPALVMTIPSVEGDFVALAVSSKGHHDNTVSVRPQDMQHGTARQDSYVRTDKLYTINGQAVEQRVGAVKPDFMQRVLQSMCKAVGCR